MIKKITIIVLLFIPGIIQAQMSGLSGHYMMNRILINPAVAGCMGNSNVGLHARRQWLGYKRAPSSFYAFGEMRFLKKKYRIRRGLFIKSAQTGRLTSNVGIGGYLFNDRFGLLNRTGLNMAYSYHVFLTRSYQLSLGISTTFYQFNCNTGDMILSDTYDPLLNDINKVMYIPDFNLGGQLQSRNFYIGLSVNSITEGLIKFGNSASEYNSQRFYYLMLGSYIYVNDKIDLEPNILFRTNEDMLIRSDIGLRALFSNLIWGGLAYRTNGDLCIFTGAHLFLKSLDNSIDIGYAMDYPSDPVRKHFGSHELILKYTIGTSERRYRWKDRY
jgi:type IX secretion system PorP/SprF family membrane protein